VLEEKSMAAEPQKEVQDSSSHPKIDYEKYVVRKALAEYWRAEEKVEIVLMGMTNRIPVTMLCRLNNVTPSLYYEWREKFMAQGKEGLMSNGGRSNRERELENKIEVLERCIGGLTLERELLKKLQS
jgi:transposase-like protein